MKLSLTIGVISSALCALGLAQASDATAPAGNAVMVQIDGAKLTTADLDRKHPGRLLQARTTYYQEERKALDEYIEEYILERQAQSEHLTLTELMDKHVSNGIAPDPDEGVLKAYYELLNTTEPYDKIRVQILEHIRANRINKLKTTYIASLRAKANVSIELPAPRVDLSMKDTPVRGGAKSPVMLVEFADYECPYCQQVQPTVEKILDEYKGKVSFGFKDTPLPMHASARKAAEATRCGEAQGKYWEMHDLLFSSKTLDVPALKQHAKELKLDSAAFDKCLDSGAKTKMIDDQLDEAGSLGLSGTPTFFINGRLMYGNLSYEQMKAAVDEEMARVSTVKMAGK